jgi:hypothetical protein
MVSGGRMTFSHLDTNLHLCVFCAQKKIGKGDVFPIQPMKAQRWNRGIAPFMLNLGSGWRWALNIMPWPLYPQEITLVPFEWKAE